MANITIYFKKVLLLFLLVFVLALPQIKASQCLPEEMKVVYEICKNSNLQAIEEPEGEDYWKAPYETERDGGGDCEDLSIWLLYKLTMMGYNCWLVLGTDKTPIFHMWVRIELKDGSFWDVDMVNRMLQRRLIEIPLNDFEFEKLQDVIKRQTEYEEGK
jgi:hypothetical protein